MTCRNCKHSFPGTGATSCPKCGNNDLYRRPDDDPKIFEQRFDEYLKKTAPLMNSYREKKKLIEINANRTIEEVLKDSLSHLKKFVR
jgi:adenylate kinase family enzyme